MTQTASMAISDPNDQSTADDSALTQRDSLQLVMFRVGDVLLGIDITYVQEINRLLEVTPVPDAPPNIHGVVNLRGEVVTVVNAHNLFAMTMQPNEKSGRNLILNLDGERIGVWVDAVSDILPVPRDALTTPPNNVSSINRRFIDSVYLMENEVIVVLDPAGLLASIEDN